MLVLIALASIPNDPEVLPARINDKANALSRLAHLPPLRILLSIFLGTPPEPSTAVHKLLAASNCPQRSTTGTNPTAPGMGQVSRK